MNSIARIFAILLLAMLLVACNEIDRSFYRSSSYCGHGVDSNQLAKPCLKAAGNILTGCVRAPRAIFDNKGRLWLAWVWGYHVYVNHSDDQGKTFSRPVLVNEIPENIAARAENRPKIAISDTGIIYVSFTKKLRARFSGYIRFSRSIDGGRSFSKPITVNDDQQMIGHRFDVLGVNKNGHVYLSWLDKRDLQAAKQNNKKYHGAAIYYAVSTDNGQKFKANKKISDHTCQCCRVAMDFDRDGLPVLVWRHIYGRNIRDHAVMKFTATNTPGQPARLSHDNWEINACPHHGPAISVDNNGVYHVVWFTNAKKRHGLFYARSTDQGKHFSTPIPFGNYNQQASHPDILTSRNRLLIVWKEFDGQISKLRWMKFDKAENRWLPPQTLDAVNGPADYPYLLADGNKTYASWHTNNNGYRLLELPAISALTRDAL